MIILDYETRSKADLPTVGAYQYAKHKTTDILCIALLDTTDNSEIVFDPIEQDMPQEWVDKLLQTDKVGAVNATFDLLIHKHIGVPVYKFPPIELERWYCISAQMRVNAMPANLEDAALAAKVANLKNKRGKELIKLLSLPQADGSFNEDAALMEEMKQYCLDDVRASADIYRSTREMTPVEHQDWLLCERMNQRGVKIDRTLATLATNYASEEQDDIAQEIAKVTNGEVTKPTQHQRIKKYVLDAIVGSDHESDKALLKIMTVHKDGKKKQSLDKNIRETIITAIDEGSLELYEDIEQLIRLLDAASASSVAKFKKMLELADPDDDRVRGAFIHAGASQTQRFSSKGLQLHNMRRVCFNAEQTDEIIARMASGEPMNSVMQTLSKLLRPALIPEQGNSFIVGDWSAIEARALPWLANDRRADKKLDLFRNGVDVYVEAAKGIYGLNEIDKSTKDGADKRQVGKIAELALGYGGAAGAFNAMASAYGVIMQDHTVKRIVRAWRKANSWAVEFWADLEKAAKNAIKSKGKRSYSAGRVTYHFIPQLLGGTLICELPDGTFIQYPFARLEQGEHSSSIVALKAAIKPKADGSSKTHWGTVRLWGGLLSENITQAFCAGLLRHKIRNSGELFDFIVAHVHDEMILEAPTPRAEELKHKLQRLMEYVPDFAEGLPLDAEPVVLSRYGNH